MLLVFVGKFWNFEENFVFIYTKTHNKLWEHWPASWEIKHFSSPAWKLRYGSPRPYFSIKDASIRACSPHTASSIWFPAQGCQGMHAALPWPPIATHWNYCQVITNKISNNNLRHLHGRLTTQWVLKAPLCDNCSAHIVEPRAAKQACTHNERPETMNQKYGRISLFRCRRKREWLEKTYLIASISPLSPASLASSYRLSCCSRSDSVFSWSGNDSDTVFAACVTAFLRASEVLKSLKE